MRSKFNYKLIVIITLSLIVIALIVWFVLSRQTKKLQDTYMAESQKTYDNICNNFENELKESDKSAIDISLIGEHFIKINKTDLGLIALNASIQKDNSIRDIALYTSKVYFDLHDYNKSLEIAKHAQDIDPVYWQTYTLLSEIYTALGDEKNSEICYNKSKDFNPENHQ